MVKKESSEVVQVVETTDIGARGIFADAILAMLAYDRDGHPYIIVVHRDGRVTLLPDTEAVREALAAAGISLVSLGKVARERYQKSWDPVLGPDAKVAIVAIDKDGKELILVIMKGGSLVVLPDTPDNRRLLDESGVPVVEPRVTDHGLVVEPAPVPPRPPGPRGAPGGPRH